MKPGSAKQTDETPHQSQQEVTLLIWPARLLEAVLWALILLNLSVMVFCAANTELLEIGIASEYAEDLAGILYPGNFFWIEILLAVERILFVPAVIIFLAWVYAANTNCHRLGAGNMKFTPGWAVGWCCIPVINLWKIFHVLDEIWQASQNPSSWSVGRALSPLGWWWLFFLYFQLSDNSFHLIFMALSIALDAVYTSWHKIIVPVMADGIEMIFLYAVLVSLLGVISSNQTKYAVGRQKSAQATPSSSEPRD